MERGILALAPAALAGWDIQSGAVPPGAETAEIEGWEPVVIGRVHALEGGGPKSGWEAANRGVGQDLDASV